MPHPRAAARRILRRHRRPIAAALAAAAMLAALTALRSPAGPTSTPASAVVASDPTATRPGEAAVPVTLASSAVASVLRPGDTVDLVVVPDDGPAHVVAHEARVVERPSGGSGLAPASGGLIVVAVDADLAVDVAASAARDELTVVIRR